MTARSIQTRCVHPLHAGDETGKGCAAGNPLRRRIVKRILVAYDGSTGADAALADLRRAGLPDELCVMVLSVAEPARPAAVNGLERETSLLPQAIARAGEFLCHRLAEQAVGQLQSGFPGWKITPAAAVNSPVWAIVDRAAAWEADLVVLGAHGQSCCARALLGSVARRVLLDVSCSIRIARPSRPPAEWGLRIVVAVDGSVADDAVIAAVLGRTWPATAEFHLVTVVEARRTAVRPSTGFSATTQPERNSAADARAGLLMEQGGNRFRAAGLNVGAHIFHGDFANRVVAHAKAWRADGVFLGVHGPVCRRGNVLDRATFVAAACAPCSFEVVKGSTGASDLAICTYK